jgi:uncharacterized paraquat-inducible protein A
MARSSSRPRRSARTNLSRVDLEGAVRAGQAAAASTTEPAEPAIVDRAPAYYCRECHGRLDHRPGLRRDGRCPACRERLQRRRWRREHPRDEDD